MYHRFTSRLSMRAVPPCVSQARLDATEAYFRELDQDLLEQLRRDQAAAGAAGTSDKAGKSGKKKSKKRRNKAKQRAEEKSAAATAAALVG
jgi:ribosomal protein L12E/L44/L45/RPP1/RPP2